MQCKHMEVVQRLEFEIIKLNDEKNYYEQQRNNYSAEFKKLFSINSELEKRIADQKLEIQSLQEKSMVFHQRDISQTQRTTSIEQ